jgi:proline racemase
MVLEPRGGNLTSSAVLVPPCDPRADIGVFFMESFGYLPMCGSDTIGLVTTLIESGRLPTADTATTTVRIDTPAGLIEATARIADGMVVDVTFVNVTAFVAALDHVVDVPGYGVVTVDVAYGGNFYVIADAGQFGIRLEAGATAPAISAAKSLLRAVNHSLAVAHPSNSAITGITHVQFFTDLRRDQPAGAAADATIMVIVEPGIVDRSPCGTGTTAKVATLMQRGVMGEGDSFVHQSVTGATFTGTALGTETHGDATGYRVSITGSGYLTAESTVVVDSRDPLRHGFLIT